MDFAAAFIMPQIAKGEREKLAKPVTWINSLFGGSARQGVEGGVLLGEGTALASPNAS